MSPKIKAPGPKKSLAVVKQLNTQVFKPVAIKSEGDLLWATEALSRLNKYLDTVVAEKEKVTKPLMAALKAERERFKPVEAKLDAAILQIRGEMSRYQTALLTAKREAEAKAAAAVASGSLSIEKAVKAIEKVGEVAGTIVADSGSVKFRTDKVVRVVDKKAIPLEYMEPDLAEIKAALLAGKEVGGVVLDEVQTVINRRASL